MRNQLPKYVFLLLLLATAATAACGSGIDSATAPAAPQPASLAVDPSPVMPETASSMGCAGQPAFGLRFRIGISTRHNLSLRGLRFDFIDRFGRRGAPSVTLLSSSFTVATPGSPIPTPSPTAMPSSSPIPMPGFVALQPSSLPAGTVQRLPFHLEFGCGFADTGTLIVIGDFLDANGGGVSVDVRARVGH